MFLWFLGRRMYWSVPADSKDVYDFAYALSQALRSIPLFLFIMLFLLNIFRKDGVAETHFHWNPRRISLIRNNLRWLTVASAPLAFAAFFANYCRFRFASFVLVTLFKIGTCAIGLSTIYRVSAC